MAGMESRAGTRVKIDAGAILEIDKSMREQAGFLRKPQKVVVYDISVVGVGIVSPVFLPKGAVFQIQMDAVDLNLDKPANIKGQVCYCRPAQEGEYKVGIKFVDIDAPTLSKIKEFVAKTGPSQRQA